MPEESLKARYSFRLISLSSEDYADLLNYKRQTCWITSGGERDLANWACTHFGRRRMRPPEEPLIHWPISRIFWILNWACTGTGPYLSHNVRGGLMTTQDPRLISQTLGRRTELFLRDEGVQRHEKHRTAYSGMCAHLWKNSHDTVLLSPYL